MKKLLSLIMLIFALNITAVYANELDDLNRVFTDIKLREKIPKLSYIYSVEKNKNKFSDFYFGELNNLDVEVVVSKTDDTVKSVKIENVGDLQYNWMDTIISYFGKPTKRSGERGKDELVAYSWSYPYYVCMLFNSKRGTSIAMFYQVKNE